MDKQIFTQMWERAQAWVKWKIEMALDSLSSWGKLNSLAQLIPFSSLIWSPGTKCTLVWFGSSLEVKGELSDGSLCFSVGCYGTRADTTPHREQRCCCQIGRDGIITLIASVLIQAGRCS